MLIVIIIKAIPETMLKHKALHPRDDVDRLYVSRKEGGRGLASNEDSVDALIQRLEDYIQKHDGGLITAMRNDTVNTMDNKMTKQKQTKIGNKNKKETNCMGVLNDQ